MRPEKVGREGGFFRQRVNVCRGLLKTEYTNCVYGRVADKRDYTSS